MQIYFDKKKTFELLELIQQEKKEAAKIDTFISLLDIVTDGRLHIELKQEQSAVLVDDISKREILVEHIIEKYDSVSYFASENLERAINLVKGENG